MSKSVINREIPRKRILVLILLALLGVSLILLSKCASNENVSKQSGTELEGLDPAEYAKSVEDKVESLCNKIDGVSSTYAVVTLKGGYRAIYATDSQAGSSNSKNQTVIIGSGSSEKALLVGYENPEIAGIGIVCSGGNDPVLRQNIISVISSAFNISTNKIFVAGT